MNIIRKAISIFFWLQLKIIYAIKTCLFLRLHLHGSKLAFKPSFKPTKGDTVFYSRVRRDKARRMTHPCKLGHVLLRWRHQGKLRHVVGIPRGYSNHRREKPMRSWVHRTTGYGKKAKGDVISCKINHFWNTLTHGMLSFCIISETCPYHMNTIG